MAHPCRYCWKVQICGAKSSQRQNNLGLLAASFIGHEDCVKAYIEKGADVKCYDNGLRNAIMVHRVSIITSGNPLTLLHDGTTLMYASGCDHIGIVKLLVNEGADVNMIKSQTTALGLAAGQGHYKCLEFLIEAGAKVNIADPTVSPALISAVHSVKISREKRVDLLLKSGADVNAYYSGSSWENTTPLVEGAKSGNPRIISLLVAAGADVNLGNRGNFPLHTALCGTCGENVKLLLEAGANVNQPDTNGSTPLHLALSPYQKSLLLELGANLNTPDNVGWTPLIAAVYRNRLLNNSVRCLKAVRMLLEVGAQINREDCRGRNALITFMQYSNSEDNLNLCMLLYAAGEKLDDPIVLKVEFPEYFKELRKKLDLKHLCREAIRKHLIDLDPHEHLFERIPQLGLPSLVTEYMLYDCTLDCKTAIEEGI